MDDIGLDKSLECASLTALHYYLSFGLLRLFCIFLIVKDHRLCSRKFDNLLFSHYRLWRNLLDSVHIARSFDGYHSDLVA